MGLSLLPFQEAGRDFLAARKRALLADEMRLGKTRQTLEAAAKVGARSVRVIGPGISRMVWAGQYNDGDYGFWFEFFSYDEARRRKEWTDVDVLIVDEVHFCKNTSAQRTKAVLGKGGAAWHADYLWFLSGTPAPNHVGELWPVLRISGVVRASYRDFTNHFCRVDSLGKIHGTDLSKAPELRGILGNFMLRRRKKEVAPELPNITIDPYPVEPDPVYFRCVWPVEADRHLRKLNQESERLMAALADLPEDEQIDYLTANADSFATQRALTALLKAPAVADLIRFQIENELVDKLVVFGYHRHAMFHLRDELRASGIKAVLVFGGTPDDKKEAAVKAFHKPNKHRKSAQVFIGNILSAGTAIDLSAAHNGIMLERDWVPGNNAQALERMGGFNQKNPISIADIILPNSVDEVVAAAVNRKTIELAEVFDL